MAHLAVCGIPVFAAAPMVKTQPGFYRMMLGDFEITALNDCVVPYPVSTMPNATEEQIKDGLSEMHLNAPVGMSYNAFLINTGNKLVLIDTGTGGKLDSDPGFHGCGHLLRNLSAAGYQPSQVDEIYITHVGPDHVGGLTIENARTFPNAIVRAAKSEVDIYIEPEKIEAALAASTDKSGAKSWFDFQRNLFEPYVKAGKFEAFDKDVTFPSGITALATHGHTPGHTSYIVKSEGQTLILMGDLVHWGAVQFPYSAMYTQFDADPKAGPNNGYECSSWPPTMTIG